VLRSVLNCDTVLLDPAFLASTSIGGAIPLSESPLVGAHDLLPSRELELGAAQGLDHVVSVNVTRADRHDDLADGHTGSHLHGLTVRATHTGGESIGSGAGKHLVLTDNVERVRTGADVVTFFASGLRHVLVARHTGSLKGASRKLLLLVRHQVGNERESIDGGLLGSAIEDSDLGIRDTTAVSALDVRLVLLHSHALGWSWK